MANTPAWFNKDYYLTSKLAQLRAAGETKYNNIVDVAVALEAAGFTAYEHFQQYSLIERTSPNPAFNATEYLNAKAAQLGNGATADSVALAIREAGMNLWEHFQTYGWKEGVNPSNSFDVKKYMESKLAQLQKDEPDAGWTAEKLEEVFSNAGIDPVSHYDQFGKSEEGVVVSPAENPVPSDGRTDGEVFTLTTGPDNIIGTAGDDIINGYISATATQSTLSAADVINGGGGKDTLNVVNEAAGSALGNATISNIEVVNVRALAASTLDANEIVGLQEVNLDRGTSTLGVTNLAKDATVGLIGNGATTLGALTATYGAAATAANVTVQGGTGTTAAGAVTINGTNALTSATITGSNGTNALTSVIFGGASAVKAVTIDAQSNLTTGNITGLAAASTITVKGAGTANIGTLEAANVTTVDASANTGGVTATLNNVTGIKFTGGAGNDVVTTGAVLAGTASVDAGEGTADRLVVGTSAHIDATAGKLYKNFEQLQVNATAADTLVDIDHLASTNTIGAVRINQNGAFDATVNNLSAAAAANVTIVNAAPTTAGTDIITIGVKGASAAGQIDTVKAALTTTTTAAGVASAQNLDLTGLTLTGVEKLELTGNGTVAATTGSVTLTTANATALDSIVITNAGTNSITIAAGHAATNLIVDASGSTGNTTINAAAYNTSTGVQLLGGSGHDVLLGVTARSDKVVGGAGNDVIAGTAIGGSTAGTATAPGTVTGSITASTAADILTGGEGRDAFAIGRVDAIANVSHITDLNLGGDAAATGVDVLYFDLATAAGTASAIITLTDAQQTNVNAAADLTAALAVVFAVTGMDAANAAAQFSYGSDTYLAINGANAGFAVADDALVKITGVTGTLDTSDIIII